MSVNYAAGLSAYDNKGKLGLPEIFDSPNELQRKVHILTEWVRCSKHIVVHTGAGVSTAAGIPDFRGPKGVWTLEAEGAAPVMNVTFDEATPTFTHMALVTLERLNILKFLVTQNVDGLHMRSRFPKDRMSELHGNVFVEKRESCSHQHVQQAAVSSVGEKYTGKICSKKRGSSIPCRGRLRDTVLDWEAALPPEALQQAEEQCHMADLSICLGSTLQIVPAGALPILTKKNGGRLVIVNLQPTKQDKHADLIIHARVDDVMQLLLKNLRIQCFEYMGPVFSPHTVHRFPRKAYKTNKRRFVEQTEKKNCTINPANGIKSPRDKKRSASKAASLISMPTSTCSTPHPRLMKRRRVAVNDSTAESSPSSIASTPLVSVGRRQLARHAEDRAITPSFDVNDDGVVRLSFDHGVRTNNASEGTVDDVDDENLRLCEFLPKKRGTFGLEADCVDECDNIVLPG